MENTLVIYKAGDVTYITSVDEDGICAYTEPPKNVDAYLKELGPGYECIPWKEAWEQISKVYERNYVKAWEEINKEDYNLAKNIVPPVNWQQTDGFEIFAMANSLFNDLRVFYARFLSTGGCFKAVRSLSIDPSILTDEILAQFKLSQK